MASELARTIAFRVMSAVATRLGVSAGILGTGATASWATFGLSVAASIALDQIVGWIINWASDPVGELEAHVRATLDDILKVMIEGDGEVIGLRTELLKLTGIRTRARTEALQRVVLEP